MRTTLESGAWIEHIPVQDVKGKQIRDYARAGKPQFSPDTIDDDGEVDKRALVGGMNLSEMREQRHDALWAIVISAWSYDVPVPVFDRGAGLTSGTEALEEIPGADYLEIDEFLKPFDKKLTAKPNPKGEISSASNGSSRARAGASHRA